MLHPNVVTEMELNSYQATLVGRKVVNSLKIGIQPVKYWYCLNRPFELLYYFFIMIYSLQLFFILNCILCML